jgi:chlorite dismutase
MSGITLDFREKGRDQEGKLITSDRRLFMQLQCFTQCGDPSKIIQALKAAKFTSVLYRDFNDPFGFGLLCFHENPEFFTRELPDFFRQDAFSQFKHKPHFTMTGRTYSIGYENNLDFVLVDRPIERVLNPDLCWAIWYPLRRKGEFEQLPDEIQRNILKEHGEIGFAFSEAEYGQDIRLACHGLDTNDNDFVIGLVGPQLAPLSALVQRMRKTDQTSKYLEKLGPFFVGQVLWQSPRK